MLYKQHSGSGWIWTVWLLALVAIYPLSVGPAVCMMERGYLNESTCQRLYEPLVRVTSLFPLVYDLIDEYACWWQGR